MTIFKLVNIEEQNIFYREAGDPNKPTFLLLHGFPTASHMFRNLIPLLENDFHLIAPDYIGFGQSSAPKSTDFDYTFDNLTLYIQKLLEKLGVDRYFMYVFDYGAPIGFRLAMNNPSKVLGIVSQNGNIYESGLGKKWQQRQEYWNNPTPEMREYFKSAFAPETIIGQYTTGERPNSVSPDGYTLDIFYSESDDYAERQSDLIYDYRTNVALYPKFQEYVRKYQPKLLAVWGKNDPIFIYTGALAFKKDNRNLSVRLLDAGHFALETHSSEIAALILEYLQGHEFASMPII